MLFLRLQLPLHLSDFSTSLCILSTNICSFFFFLFFSFFFNQIVYPEKNHLPCFLPMFVPWAQTFALFFYQLVYPGHTNLPCFPTCSFTPGTNILPCFSTNSCTLGTDICHTAVLACGTGSLLGLSNTLPECGGGEV